VPTSAGDDGSYTATVTTEDDSASAAITGPSLAVSIEETNNPFPGEQLLVTALVKNVGTFGDSQSVEMTSGLGGDSTDVSLQGGDSQLVTFSTSVDGVGNAPYEVTVSTEDDSASTTLFDGPMGVSISDTTVASKQVSVTAYVSKSGEFGGTQTIGLDIPGLGTDSTTVSLRGGHWTWVTLSVDLTAGDEGSYTATVSSADDSDSTGVTVSTDFQVSMSIEVKPEEIGEPAIVFYEITNEGDVPDSQDVTFSVNGSTEDISGGVSLDVGSVEEGSFTYTPAVEDMPQIEFEVGTDDDTASSTLELESYYEVDIEYVTDTVLVGDPAVAIFNVTNTGNIVGGQDIDLTVDGTVVDTKEDVAIAPGETETEFVFEYLITEEELYDPPEFTVSSRNDNESQQSTRSTRG
jgi:hypothetical protein